MQQTIKINIPRLGEVAKKFFQCEESVVTCLASSLAKMDLVALAWLMRQAVDGSKHLAFVADETGRYIDKLSGWLSVSGIAIAAKGNVATILGSTIVFTTHKKIESVGDIDHLVLVDAHKCEESPLPWVAQYVKSNVRLVGSATVDGHWFTNACRETKAFFLVTADDAVEAGTTNADMVQRVRGSMSNAEFDRLHKPSQAMIHSVSSPGSDGAIVKPCFTRFSRERLWIRTKTGDIIPFNVNPIQHRYLARKRIAARLAKAVEHSSRILLLKYRRGGFSTLEQGLSYFGTVTQHNYRAVTLAHTKESTQTIFEIAKLFHRRDPNAPLRTGGNKREISIPQLNSSFKIGTAGSDGFARGDTLSRVHGSEVSKWLRGPNQRDKVADLVAGLTEACSHGEVIFETTPNGTEWFCETYRAAKRKQNNWTPVFLPWFEDFTNALTVFDRVELLDTLSDREKALMEHHKLSHGQIAWRRMKIRDVGRLFVQEYPEDDETCFITSGDMYFDASKIVDWLEELPEYDRPHVPGGYYIEWEAPIPGVDYVVGADTSEGVSGSDPSGCGVLRRDTGAQVAALHGRFVPADLARRCVDIAERFNNAFLGVERNNHGHAVILQIGNIGYSNMFFDHDSRPGWVTDGQSRPVLLSELAQAIEHREMAVRDRDLLDECTSFKRQKNGKYSADTGCHDDAVMKWGIAWQMRKYRGQSGPSLGFASF